MWQQIALNKRNSYILMALMLIFLLIIGAAFGILTIYYSIYIDGMTSFNQTELMIQSAQIGLVIAFIVWVILLISALSGGKNAILALNSAYKLPANAHNILENVVEEMSIAAGLPKPPEIYVIDTPMPNAFATGMNPKRSAIAVTTGLLTELNRDELQGVVAHEIAHIVNRDTMYMIFAGVMIGSILFISEFGMRLFTRGNRHSRSRSRSSGKAEIIILLICILLMILAPIVAQLLYFSVSQKREYLADACAAQFTRYPQGLASALAKISGCVMSKDVNKISAAMYIVNPLKNNSKKVYSMFENAFSTHPPTSKRIEILSKMSGADINSYNEAFKSVAKNGQTILSKEALYGVKSVSIVNPNKVSSQQAATVAMGFVAGLANEQTKIQEDEQNNIKRTRKRAAEDIILKANDYIFKECSCGTKFKIPQEYKGQEIKCPHCKNNISVT